MDMMDLQELIERECFDERESILSTWLEVLAALIFVVLAILFVLEAAR